MRTTKPQILLPLLLAALTVFGNPNMAQAQTNPDLLAESEQLAIAVMRSSLATWDQSSLRSYYPRIATIWGGVERIAEFTDMVTPEIVQQALGTADKEITGQTLGYMLTSQCQPSQLEYNPYIDVTIKLFPNGKSFEFLLYEGIMNHPGKVMPSDVLYMALYLCEDDYWLATLTAHNLLKEVAYASRDKYSCVLAQDPKNPRDVNQHVVINPQDVLNKLANLRKTGDPHYTDVIGPWYHMFGILFFSGVTSCEEALLLGKAENLTRWLGLGSSRDPFKESVNIWAAHTSEMLNDIVGENPNLVHKYLKTWPEDTIREQLDWINKKHGEIQGRLESERAVILKGEANAPFAEEHMDYLRAYQRALVAEAKKLQGELAGR